jgi:hypothetical protein
LWRGDVRVYDRQPGADSVYNNPGGGTSDYVVSYGRSVTRGVEKHWEVGAGGGFDFKVVKVDVEGKYGKAFTDSATTSKGYTLTVPVKDGWTAWIRADFYQRVVYWKAFTWRWDAGQDRCEKRTISRAFWGDPKRQYVVVQKKGRHLPREVALSH